MGKLLLCGVGVKDLKTERSCKFYRVWADMITRCYNGKSVYYIDISVCSEWHLFSTFKSWMEKQDWEGKALDKDLLSTADKKVYSPETCCFISQKLNGFLREPKFSHKDHCLPLGVRSRHGKFIAELAGRHLGTFEDIHTAKLCYDSNRFSELLKLSEQESDPRVRVAIKLKYSVK